MVFEAMRAFLRSSEECFQLKQQRTTIGRHEGSDIVLKVWMSMPWAVGVSDGWERHQKLEGDKGHGYAAISKSVIPDAKQRG